MLGGLPGYRPRLAGLAAPTPPFGVGVESPTYSKTQREAGPLGARWGSIVNTSLSPRVFPGVYTPEPPHLSIPSHCFWVPNLPSLPRPNHPVSSQRGKGRR